MGYRNRIYIKYKFFFSSFRIKVGSQFFLAEPDPDPRKTISDPLLWIKEPWLPWLPVRVSKGIVWRSASGWECVPITARHVFKRTGGRGSAVRNNKRQKTGSNIYIDWIEPKWFLITWTWFQRNVIYFAILFLQEGIVSTRCSGSCVLFTLVLTK